MFSNVKPLFFFHEQTSICTLISYTIYFICYVEFPKKVIENDGRKLARHIKNRGRPTEQTWQKYREFRRQRNVLAGKRINYVFFKGQETLYMLFKELKLQSKNSPLTFYRVIVALARENILPGILLSFFQGIAK